MDRRSWPWKKKSSSEKTLSAAPLAGSSNGTDVNQENKDNLKNVVSYVQLSQERYAQLSGMENQVKFLGEELSTVKSELTTKDALIKQHTKVAEEAVSGWEKAEAEALTLKSELESTTLLRLAAEDRAVHLDGALKECMQEIRDVKEESERKLHDVVFAKTKQWEKVKLELDAKINIFEEELLRAAAENDALSRSLQERSSMLMKISEEKAEAEVEIEILKTNIQACEKELSSMKYEVHIVTKELEIRNEEKNMSVRSAEVANKQHLEDVKKVTKLEAECQRLRGLVRKKLPGPAALAQMKMEVESLGIDYGESRFRRSPAKTSNTYMLPFTDFTLESLQHYQKENELLTARLLATEEETKMLKEALAKRNSELQVSRNMLAKTSSKLRSLEEHMLVSDQQRSPSKFSTVITIEGNPPSMASISEDGNNERENCTNGSWTTSLIPELLHLNKDKDIDKSSRASTSSHLELMDDFLEMERLACLSSESNGLAFNGIMDNDNVTENSERTILVTAPKDVNPQRENQSDLQSPSYLASSDQQISAGDSDQNKIPLVKLQSRITSIFEEQGKDTDISKLVTAPKDVNPQRENQSDLQSPSYLASSDQQISAGDSDQNKIPLVKLQSRITSIFEEQGKDTDISKLLEDIKSLVLEIELLQQPVGCIVPDVQSVDSTNAGCPEDMITTKLIAGNPALADGLREAVSLIHDFVMLLVRSNTDVLAQDVSQFSSVVNKVLSDEFSVHEFVVTLSAVLSRSKECGGRICFEMDSERDIHSSDCIDKVTLLENEIVQRESGKDRFSDSSSDAEILCSQSGPNCEMKDLLLARYSLKEVEQLKLEKDNLTNDLAKCTESLQCTKSQLLETEQHLEDLKSQLNACQETNSLAETQLKCMAESYRSLESRLLDMESEINNMQSKIEALDLELKEEKCAHEEDLAKYKDLQEQIERNCKCSTSSDPEAKTIQKEMEIAAAAEKLAQCQETIFLLGRHLKSMQPQADQVPPSPNGRINNVLSENILSTSSSNPQDWPGTRIPDHTDTDNSTFPFQKIGGKSPFLERDHYSPCDAEAVIVPKSPISSKARSSRSSSSNPIDEKHGGSFSRFFSKGRSYN